MSGKHTDEILNLLRTQVGNESEVADIAKTAREVMGKWVNPVSGGKEQTNGLIYGLVQSGKTGVLTVTGAMGADEGYRTLIVLTSDIDPLYEQTRGRVCCHPRKGYRVRAARRPRRSHRLQASRGFRRPEMRSCPIDD